MGKLHETVVLDSLKRWYLRKDLFSYTKSKEQRTKHFKAGVLIV